MQKKMMERPRAEGSPGLCSKLFFNYIVPPFFQVISKAAKASIFCALPISSLLGSQTVVELNQPRQYLSSLKSEYFHQD